MIHGEWAGERRIGAVRAKRGAHTNAHGGAVAAVAARSWATAQRTVLYHRRAGDGYVICLHGYILLCWLRVSPACSGDSKSLAQPAQRVTTRLNCTLPAPGVAQACVLNMLACGKNHDRASPPGRGETPLSEPPAPALRGRDPGKSPAATGTRPAPSINQLHLHSRTHRVEPELAGSGDSGGAYSTSGRVMADTSPPISSIESYSAWRT